MRRRCDPWCGMIDVQKLGVGRDPADEGSAWYVDAFTLRMLMPSHIICHIIYHTSHITNRMDSFSSPPPL